MSSPLNSSSKIPESKKRSLPFRLFGRKKRAKTSSTPYSSPIEEDLKLLRNPLPPFPMLPAVQTQSMGAPSLPVVSSPVANDYPTSPSLLFPTPTPTISHPSAGITRAEFDTQSFGSSEDESDEYSSPSSYNSYSTPPFPQSSYSQYAFAAQNYQGGVTASATYQASAPAYPSNGIYVDDATGATNVVMTQAITYQHPPQDGGYTRHSTTFAYSHSPHYQTRSYTNNSVSISGPDNTITFGPRRQTMSM